MTAPRSGACAAVLGDGRLLVAGGQDASGPVSTVDIYGTDGAFTAGPAMSQARAQAACASLPDGRVLVTGGDDGSGALNTAEIFDPVTGQWQPAGNLSTAREGHQAALYGGNVWIAGGTNQGAIVGTVELYVNGQFHKVGSLNTPRADFALAPSGQRGLLIAGGTDGTNTLNTVEAYDGLTGSLTVAGTMLQPRRNFAAATLWDGTLFLAGGMDAYGSPLATTEIFNPASGVSTPGPPLLAPRANHAAQTLLNNGAVLIFGGAGNTTVLNTTEIYTPWNRTIAPGSPLNWARRDESAAILRSGSFLIAGGRDDNGPLRTSELFQYSTITTDRPAYPPGTPVVISGGGWIPGEQVLVQIQAQPLDGGRIEFTGVGLADGAGNISVNGFAVDKSHLGDTFLVTATGSQSKAQNTFSDSTTRPRLTTTSISMTSGPSGNTPYGSITPYVATVTVTGGGTATGTVTFCDSGSLTCSGASDPNAIGTVTLTNANNNIASLTPSTPLAVGAHTILASYSGNSSDASSVSSNSIVTNIQATNTTTSYTLTPGGGSATAPPATIVFSQPVSATATVAAQTGGGTPTGTVQFAVDSAPVGGANTLTGGSTGAVLLNSTFAIGNHTVSATFTPAGGTGWNGSSGNNGGATAITVTQANTTVATSLTSGAGTGTPTFTVTVTGTAPATANPTTGPVTLYDGTPANAGASTLLGSGTLSGTNSVQITSTVTLTAAGNSHTIWAAYAGNASFAAGNSTGQVYNVAPPIATTVQTPTGPSSISYGQAITFTGTVTAASGAQNPGGAPGSGNSLKFCIFNSVPAQVLCSGNIQVTNTASPLVGQASFTIPATTASTNNPPALAPGTYTVTTTYTNNDGSFSNSGPSSPFTFTVTKGPTRFTITSPDVTSGQGVATNTTVTLTATYTGFTLPNPTGSVTFVNSADANATICTATLVNGVATCTATTGPGGAAGLAVGPVTATMSYAGDSNYSLGTVTTLSFTVLSPPSISKSFGGTTMPPGGSTSLSFTITNSNSSVALTGVGFADTLPSGMTVATPNGLAGSCGGGTITATAGSGSVQLAGATIAAATHCTFSVNITASAPGSYSNTTSAVTSTNGGSGNTGSASLTVLTFPTIAKAFNPTTVAAGSTSQLTFTVSNPNNAVTLTGASFTDVLPSGLVVATPNGLTGPCAGTITAAAGSSTIALSGASIAPNSTCTFSVNVLTSTAGTKNNTTGPVASNETGASSNTASATLTVNPGTATHFTVSAPATATAGTAFNFTVTALDPFNNTATGYSGTVRFTSSDGQAVLPANSTLTSGAGTFSATLKTSGAQTITATDTVSSTITGTSNSIAVSSAAATHFSVSAPTAATAGTAFTFTVTALDPFNNTATGYSGTVHFTSTDGQAVLPANSTLTNGAGTFSANLKTPGGQTLTATDTVSSTITGTSNTIAVSSAAATHFSVSAPTAATAGTAFNFTVTALDPFNNTATGYSGTVHFTSSDGQALLPANSSLTNGTGMFSATLKTSGAQTLTATDTVSGTITGTSNTIAVSSAASTHFTVSAPATATAGTAFNFTVTALDQFNNTATGYSGTVHFTSTDGQAVLPGNSTLTGGTGAFTATLKTTGARVLSATDTANASLTAAVTVTVVPGPPASITVNSGTPQTANINTGFSAPLSLTVFDAFGNVIPGLTVTYTAPASGPSATFFGGSTGSSNQLSASMAARPDRSGLRPETAANIGTAVTNAQGVASINAVANNAAGTYIVTATAGSITVSFSLTNSLSATSSLNPSLGPTFVTLRYQQGGNTAAAIVNVSSDQPSTYSAATSVPWLTITPPTGSTNRSVTVTGNGSGLAPGIYSATVVFTFGDGSSLVLPVQMYVTAALQFKPDTLALTFTAPVGSTTTQQQSFYMRSAGTDFAATLSLADVSGDGGAWLNATPASFNTPALIQVQVNPTSLAVGVYVKNIIFSGAASNSPLSVSVTFNITPVIMVTSVVNGASFAVGPVAPNTIVTAYGTFPGCSANAQAAIDGTATTVFYSSPTQISLLVPALVAGEATAQLQIACNGLTASSFPVPIVALAPALFTVTQNGQGQAAVVNQDNSVDTPSPAGTVIELYGTGFGVYAAPGADGLMHLAQTVTAAVGGVPAQVLYAGQAPDNTLGLQQIDILIPTGVASGTTAALQLIIGGVGTQANLTVAIK